MLIYLSFDLLTIISYESICWYNIYYNCHSFVYPQWNIHRNNKSIKSLWNVPWKRFLPQSISSIQEGGIQLFSHCLFVYFYRQYATHYPQHTGYIFMLFPWSFEVHRPRGFCLFDKYCKWIRERAPCTQIQFSISSKEMLISWQKQNYCHKNKWCKCDFEYIKVGKCTVTHTNAYTHGTWTEVLIEN